MSTDTLAYSYTATARILAAKGLSDSEIERFLTKHQNDTGYIQSGLIRAACK